LHPGYGTLEIRGCDAQTDVADAVALVGLAQTLVAWLAARYDAGEHLPVHSTHLISESLRIGARSGAGGELLDLETGERQPVTIRVRTLLDQLAPVAVELGTERELGRISLMASTGGADRQKAIVEERGQDGLVGWLASETLASAQMYLARARTS
jgi:carboxylate-amine ligase